MTRMDTILFDLDGTLLPLEEDIFTKKYFSLLGDTFARYGYDGDALLKAMWVGTDAMIHNDGTATNAKVFWDTFAGLVGEQVRALEAVIGDFYRTEFHGVRDTAGENHLAAPCIRMLQDKGYRLVLTSNPLFPREAYETRLSWVDVPAAAFLHYTTYDNSRHCKPHPGYFSDTLAAVMRTPAQCLMVGDHAQKDIAPAQEMGFATFWIDKAGTNQSYGDLRGDFAAFAAYAASLPSLKE